MQLKTQFSTRQQPYSNQSSGNKKVSVASVKTPSLLFYRPNTNSTRKTKSNQGSNQYQGSHPITHKTDNQLQRKNMSTTNDHPCQNHHHIPAKYISRTGQQDDIIYYCDKCANLLLSQGFQVVPLSQPDPKQKKQPKPRTTREDKKKKNWELECYPFPERQHQIQCFLGSLHGAREEINTNSAKIREILVSSEQFYGQQIEQINQYFQTIAQSLQLQKNKCYNHILLQRQNAQKAVRQTIIKLKQGQKQIDSMVGDIEQNLDSVYSISWQNYKLVIEAFKTRIKQIDKMLNEIRINGITDTQYRKIQFTGVPQSINSLSDIIIQNSYGTIHGSDGTMFFTTEHENGSSIHDKNMNIQDHSIFDKLKVQHSCDSAQNKEHPRHMMFSFSSEKIRSCVDSQGGEADQNNPFKERRCIEHDEQPIKLIRNRNSLHLGNKDEQKMQTVAGIKEVEEVDALVIDDDDSMNFPPNIRINNR